MHSSRTNYLFTYDFFCLFVPPQTSLFNQVICLHYSRVENIASYLDFWKHFFLFFLNLLDLFQLILLGCNRCHSIIAYQRTVDIALLYCWNLKLMSNLWAFLLYCIGPLWPNNIFFHIFDGHKCNCRFGCNEIMFFFRRRRTVDISDWYVLLLNRAL